ncbi:MAG: 3'(2'),5'-bisphosphate nucleotidase CysQ [Gemmatimonadota bacterium]
MSDLIIPPGVPSEFREEARAAVSAALAGGRAAMDYYGADLTVTRKEAGDPVTLADLAANRAILDEIQSSFPADSVLSEESDLDPGSVPSERLWIIDPLDGTKEFIARNGEFCVMVGLAIRGEAVLGVTCQPQDGIVLLGVPGAGSWLSRGDSFEAVHVEPEAHGPLRMTRSRSHPDERLQALEDGLPDAIIVPSGSVGVKCSLIVRDKADLYAHPVPFLKEWDTCAPEAILRGAGGRVTDCSGAPLRYGKRDPRQPGGIFAARADVWAEVLPTVQEISVSMFNYD